MTKNSRSEQLIRVTGNFSKRQKEMFDSIKEAVGFKSDSAVMQYLIAKEYQKLYPSYKSGGSAQSGKDPEMKAFLERQRLEEIAKALGGTIVTDQAKNEWVTYRTYNLTEEYPQRVQLASLEESMIERQFYPTKEIVNEARVAVGKQAVA